MAKSSSKQNRESTLMGLVVIIAVIIGAVVVLASQKYSAVGEIESQVEADGIFNELMNK